MAEKLETQQYYCRVCRRTMGPKEFYTSKRIDKYPPDGKLPECRKCLTRHVDNWNPDTYLWILEEMDVPYIPDEWNTLMVRYCQDPATVTGTTVLGRYLSKMKLTQYNKYGWDDTEKLQAEARERTAAILRRQEVPEEQIQEELDKAEHIERPDPPPSTEAESDGLPRPIDLGGKDYFEDNLTEDDRRYLSLKWGKEFRPQEWVQMEQLYQDMTQAFIIDSPAHIDNLKLYCKASLKAHQLIAIGDVEGFQKMAKSCDMLMKSGNWAAAQNKEKTSDAWNAVGELVAMAEKEGPIPRFYIAQPNDKVDETLQDMNSYTNKLVREELNLGNLIENSLRAMARETSREEDEEIVDMDNTDRLFEEKDYIEYADEIDNQSDADAKALNNLLYDDEEDGANGAGGST